MKNVVVVMMGGARIVYEIGATFEIKDREGWLIVNGKDNSPVAAFPEHRVSRVYYAYDPHDNKGDGVIGSVGI